MLRLAAIRYNRGMAQAFALLQTLYNRTWRQGHFVGLVVGTIFLAESLTPSLLPRPYVVQGILCGIAAAVGYGIGVFLGWLWLYLEIPTPANKFRRWLERITTAAVLLVALYAFWKSAVWQNSIRADGNAAGRDGVSGARGGDCAGHLRGAAAPRAAFGVCSTVSTDK